MAQTKAELKSEASKYRRLLTKMRKEHSNGELLNAIKTAMDACSYVDGMMQFERRFENSKERESVETIDFLLNYCPLVFDQANLTNLAEVLNSHKRIDKYATADLAARLQQAINLMWDSHRLWCVLEKEGELSQESLQATLGGNSEHWRAIAKSWEHLELIDQIPDGCSYRISLKSAITISSRAKCSACGVKVRGARGSFWEDVNCPKCGATTTFVILASAN